ncbi:hypothetical protein [Arsenicicoccus dermatophilus]|uniref:hypothetical protein n=1 Tax=Arsenicicoccus dermatophilus TaxID=1076331 RepID=UPI003916FEEB
MRLLPALVAGGVGIAVGLAAFGGAGGEGAMPEGAPTSAPATAPTAGDVDCGIDGTVRMAGMSRDQLTGVAALIGHARSLGANDQALVVMLATASQESGLRNLDYGDRDSLGYFQQRPSMGWGTAAQIRTPRFAVESFLKGRGGNPGLFSVKGWQALPVTVAAQRVQKSGFPSAYADDEPLARALVQKLTGHIVCRGGAPAGGPLRVDLPRNNPRSPDQAVAWALSKVGTPVRPSICQAWVSNAYGWSYSGRPTAINQWDTTPRQMKHPGDENPPAGALVFYWSRNPARHVALSVGGGWIVTTDSPRGRIGKERLVDLKSWGPYLGWAAPYYPVAG